jgi:hypothetical protein
MIAWDCVLPMGVGRFSRPQRVVGVISMPDAELDTTQRGEAPPGAGVLRLLVFSVAFRVFSTHRCVEDNLDVTH